MAERDLERENQALRDLLGLVFNCWTDYRKAKHLMYEQGEPFSVFAIKHFPASEGPLLDACVEMLGIGGWRGSVKAPESDEVYDRINAYLRDKQPATQQGREP